MQSVESEVDDRCRVERENLAHREAADNCIAERLTHLGPGSAFDYERRSTLADGVKFDLLREFAFAVVFGVKRTWLFA